LSQDRTYTNEELIDGCLANDRICQEALYRKNFPAMMSMCLRYTKDKEAAMEIVNNGMLRVFQKIDKYSQTGSLEGWIRKICYHAISDYFKKNSKYLKFLVFDSDNNQNLEKPDEKSPEENLFYADIIELVKKLPENTEKVFRLHAIDGYTHKEIAERLNLSEGTSKWHLNSARTKLKEMLQHLDSNEKKENYAR